MSTVGLALHRRRRVAPAVSAGLLAPALGVGVAESPVLGTGLVGLAFLTLLPWAALFSILVASSVANKQGVNLAGITLRVAQAMLLPFALRTYLFTTQSLRPRWRFPEWALASWILVQFLASYLTAELPKQSFLVAGILGLGAITYLSVYTSVCTPHRVRLAARVFLAVGAIGAGVGILALAAHLAGGSKFGIDFRYQPVLGGAPSVAGLAYEHDIFGSTCAAVAVAFLVLWREDSDLFTRKWTVRFLWMTLLGLLISQARGAWLGFAMVAALYLVFRRRRRNPRPKLVRTGFTLMVLAAFGVGLLYLGGNTDSSGSNPVNAVFITTSTKLSGISLSATTAEGRLRKWESAVNEVMDSSPFLGLGTNSYGQRHFHPSKATAPYLAPSYIESLYVRTLYDSGIVGLAVLLAFLGWVLWPRWEVRQGSHPLSVVARALTLGWLVLAAAYAITDAMLLVWPWVMLGLVRAAGEVAAREESATRRISAPARARPTGRPLAAAAR